MKPHAAAPVIETQRLRLRALTPADLDPAFAMWNEPEVYRHITGKPSSREDVWGGILRLTGLWQLRGMGYWAVEEKVSGKFVGECGFGDFKREMTVPMDEPEMGWAFAKAFHGKGYGTEACTAAAKWGDDNLGAQTTACITAPENTVSNRLAEKLGFVKVAETIYKTEPTWLFHRKRGAT